MPKFHSLKVVDVSWHKNAGKGAVLENLSSEIDKCDKKRQKKLVRGTFSTLLQEKPASFRGFEKIRVYGAWVVMELNSLVLG